MPRYSVEDVLDIIRTLTLEEKKSLKAQLDSVLNTADSQGIGASVRNQQSQSFGNITIGDSGAFDVNQIATEGSVNVARDTAKSQENIKEEIKQVLDLLQIFKQELPKTEELNKLEKKNAEATISVLEEEIKKPKPDKTLLSQASKALEDCFKGVVQFAEPALAIVQIIALL